MKIAYDIRTNEWVNWDEVSYLPPELFFEIKKSPDNKYYHSFVTKDGSISFSSINNNDFMEQYNPIRDKILYRKSYSVPAEEYEKALKYYHLN